MSGVIHKNLASGRWHAMPLAEQLGNVGSEAVRVAVCYKRGMHEARDLAIDRMLELLDLTIADSRWEGSRQWELLRLREVLCDTFVGRGEYGATAATLEEYFLPFAQQANALRM